MLKIRCCHYDQLKFFYQTLDPVVPVVVAPFAAIHEFYWSYLHIPKAEIKLNLMKKQDHILLRNSVNYNYLATKMFIFYAKLLYQNETN